MLGQFMLVVYVSMLVVMMILMLLFKLVLPYCWCFWSGNFGTILHQTFTLIVWLGWGEDLLLLLSFVVSFRGRYCGSLSCLSTIHLRWVLGMFASPTLPSTSSNLPGHSDRTILWQAKCFFQDLWANQCCCTDRFSPISTVPSDENIVDWAEALWDLPHQAALRKRRTWPNAVSVAGWSGPCRKWGTHSGLWPEFSVFLRCLAHELVSHVSKPFLTNRVVGFADYQLAANRRRVACQRCCQNLCSPWPLEAFSDSLARAATGRPYRSDTLQAERLPSRFSSHSWIWRSARWERCIWTPMAQHWKRLLPGRLCSAL